MAKSKAHPTARSRRERARAERARRRRNQMLLLWGSVALFAVIIGAVIALNIRNSRPVAGEETFASQGNLHIAFGSVSPIAYNSTPPSSGPHYETLVSWGVYTEPQRYEHLVHNLEDGGVIVYYQCPEGCPEVVDALREIVDPYIQARRHVIMVPNDPSWTIGNSQPLHQDMGARIAVVAWQKVLKMDEVDAERIRAFIERYEGIDHHVAGIG
ncbi:DUF3105 domain-containing protein [Litorilinea aerophila]|uniref:DUF3105 domain-containing protein n=1 Tax=Litorilinea aerophila TaxID=1204385 RepID=A0A540VI53_9CHLR|nr:DUF3105 domain-containing protein [Litorilinea aerophila]MCC9076079.1 DUF3105 domain-containing protein [Litorilinea aerophila]GIV80512.1 MAG: hypothetical protein KatS3mg050_4906 [Litorilinea sp.]